jgi:inosose dehydratase
VHFKDFRAGIAEQARRERWEYHLAVAGGLFCELGVGDIDFPALIDCLRSTGYSGWIVVEDEIPPGFGNRLENATRDRAYLRWLGL